MDGLIFDVDGTLWDSTDIVAEAWTEYLRETEKLDISITGEQLKPLFGKLLPDIAAVVLGDFREEERMRLLEGCCAHENEVLARRPAPLYPDLEEVLSALSEKIPLFIVSNCQAGYIEAFLQGTGYGRLFRDHLCPGDTGEAKAANIRRICRRHNLKTPFYLGDTLGDYQASCEAGIPFIHAAYGFGEVPEARYRIRNLRELIDFAETFQ